MDELITWLIGGGLLTFVGAASSVVTLKYTKKSAEADAMAKMQEVYQKMIDDLRDDKKESRDEVQELRQSMAAMSRDVEENKRQVIEMKPLKCIDMGCLNRKQ